MSDVVVSVPDYKALVEKVNQLLLAGEPDNISVDTYSGYTGYKPQCVVDAMNAVFAFGQWGFDEFSSDLEPSDKGALIVSHTEVWLDGVKFHPKAWGQSRVTKGDIGDARKGAQTDAIKKALSYFSIGNRAYLGLLPDKQEQASNARQNQAEQRQRQERSAPQPARTQREQSPNGATPDQLQTIRQLATEKRRRVATPTTSDAAKALIAELRAAPVPAPVAQSA